MASILNIIAMNHSMRLRDELELDREKQAEEAKKKRAEELRQQEYDLQHKCVKIEGWEKFEAWYFSDAVPDYTTYKHRIELVSAHLAELIEALAEKLGESWQAYFDAEETEGAAASQIEAARDNALAIGRQYQAVYEADGTEPSPIISGGEILYLPHHSNISDEAMPF